MFRAAIVLALVLSPAAALAAQPKKCFSLPEIKAEQEVRQGIFLREAANRCNERLLPGARDRWQKIEGANGAKFRSAVDKRQKAWQREFPDDWKYQINYADGRLVTYARNISLTEGFCDNIDDLLQTIEKRGFAAFSKLSKVVRNQVTDDYKVCQ
ncbi:hypothetical protein WV31_18555 [Magnetospirillum sp. ME-1]|uniref:hypothetical protein n=1 Tax=Magnetospirillum sp. ME-1 TaxID=1639348 RepID=UPI000A17AFC3|nr:hypothetical protein [Magnetospirillum sp. ME-1]ARJ67515.1 hypothetical protein WV31_18555 [Magnetospirillum sp. ME-1]